MKQQQTSLIQQSVVENICALMGDKAVGRTQVSDWHAKFRENDFSVSDFVLLKFGNRRGLSDFSEKTIHALVVYLKGRDHSAKKITEFLNQYFDAVRKFNRAEIDVSLLGDYFSKFPNYF
jgi:hypothetical protein